MQNRSKRYVRVWLFALAILLLQGGGFAARAQQQYFRRIETSCTDAPTGTVRVVVNVPEGGRADFRVSNSDDYVKQQVDDPVFTDVPAGEYEVQVRVYNERNDRVFDREYEVSVNDDDYTLSLAEANGRQDVCAGQFNGRIVVETTQAGIANPQYSFFLYAWDGDAAMDATNTTGEFGSLQAGSYGVKVVEATTRCTATLPAEVIINEFSPPTLMAVQSKLARCEGELTGMITAEATSAKDGSNVFRYTLNDDTEPQHTPVFGGLAAGNYTVTVTDGNNCWATKEVNVRTPALGFTATGSKIICKDDEGVITAKTTVERDLDGNLGTVDHYWLDMNGEHYGEYVDNIEFTYTFPRLTPGVFTVHVKDSYGCTTQAEAIVSGPAEWLGPNIRQAMFFEEDANGYIIVSPDGGWGGYTISCYLKLLDGNFTLIDETSSVLEGENYTFNGLVRGEYQVVVTDSEGCINHTVVGPGSVTSVPEIEVAATHIYPNPSSGQFYIEWKNTDVRRATIEVYSITGRLVYRSNIQTGSSGVRSLIDVGIRESGIYLMRIPELNITQKLVIRQE